MKICLYIERRYGRRVMGYIESDLLNKGDLERMHVLGHRSEAELIDLRELMKTTNDDITGMSLWDKLEYLVYEMFIDAEEPEIIPPEEPSIWSKIKSFLVFWDK